MTLDDLASAFKVRQHTFAIKVKPIAISLTFIANVCRTLNELASITTANERQHRQKSTQYVNKLLNNTDKLSFYKLSFLCFLPSLAGCFL